MKKHIEILGWLFIGYYAIFLILGVVAFILLFGVALIPDIGHEEGAILGLIAVVAGFFYVLLAAPGIIGGIGLLKRQNWARILVIILCFLNLIAFPFGTALGIFGLWLLLKEETTKYFTGT